MILAEKLAEMDVKKAIVASFVALFLVIANSVTAQSLTRYCMDTRSAGCMPRFIPFEGNSIDFCEESCTLTNPVDVRGLNAVLYDLSCYADYDTPLDGIRVMILRQVNRDGITEISWIEENSITEIVPCPQRY